ncbi:phosphoribomutase [Pichia kluyveri]|uniref:Phosphoribomutase n=1 Tax=Pichia kluyveri TaxID=36015 RepID=A0AAV5R7M0_PICKL|nr:phosphoribomutase [Pichia kluyveri]
MQKLIEDWLAIDVNPTTRAQITELAKNIVSNHETLHDLLGKRIVFGTAGLRARMEAGFSRMNDVTVLQASQGLAEYIKSTVEDNARLSIVIGHDHRHNSKRFAELAIAVFINKGFQVYYIGDNNCATPMVPFAVDKYSTDGGIMITASHNPKDDNGYKVYWNNGCQIIPPHDSNIQNSILENLTPILNNDAGWNTDIYMRSDKLIYCFEEVVDSYVDYLRTSLFKDENKIDFKFVYTAMHGVGYEFVEKLLKGVTPNENFVKVEGQCSPNPDFPTVKFPNPEENGALTLATETADKHNVNLVLANDPDADRFTAAFKSFKKNKWIQLSGNEIGILFADYVISLQDSSKLDKLYILNSTVSSQFIGSMAKKLGFNFKDTLTGFKWIGNEAINLENQGFQVPFAYEEAIGFMFKTVHDKDGMAALLMFLQLYQKLIKEGLDPVAKLEQLYEKFGYFKQYNGYYITEKPNTIKDIFDNVIRSNDSSIPYPKTLGNFSVIEWRDLTIGYDSITEDNKPKLFVDPTSQMITCTLATGAENESIRFTARGSGTEPKLKVYIEAQASNEVRSLQLAEQVWVLLREEWFQPSKHELIERRV